MTKLLIIEDDIPFSNLVEAVLASSGEYCISKTTTLHEGIAWIEAHEAGEIDAVLLDLKLPDSHPENTVSEVKKAAKNKAAIVVLSANKSDGMEERCIRSNANGFVDKDKPLRGLDVEIAKAIENWARCRILKTATDTIAAG